MSWRARNFPAWAGLGRRRRDLVDWLIIVLPIVIVLAVVIPSIVDCRGKARCRADGGRVEEFNCGPVLICDGQGSCWTQEQCDWRCVDLPAERGPQ